MRSPSWGATWTACCAAANKIPEKNTALIELHQVRHWSARLDRALSLSTGWNRDVRLNRLRGALLAALGTRAYRERLERAGLATPSRILRLRTIEEALQRLPRVDWREFCSWPADFCNPAAPDPGRLRLLVPAGRRPLRTAVLDHRFVQNEFTRVFLPSRVERIRRFCPEAVAGSMSSLRRLKEKAGDSLTVTHALIVFTGLDHGAMSQAERDWLWQIFEVPVFEQCLGLDGRVLAWECEAHSGLHIVDENVVAEPETGSGLIVTSLTDQRHPAIRIVTRIRAELESQACECGLPGVRLMGSYEARSEQNPRALAASSGL